MASAVEIRNVLGSRGIPEVDVLFLDADGYEGSALCGLGDPKILAPHARMVLSLSPQALGKRSSIDPYMFLSQLRNDGWHCSTSSELPTNKRSASAAYTAVKHLMRELLRADIGALGNELVDGVLHRAFIFCCRGDGCPT